MTKGTKEIFSIVTLMLLWGCSTFSREEKDEYKEWIESSDGQMVSIHVWNKNTDRGGIRGQSLRMPNRKKEESQNTKIGNGRPMGVWSATAKLAAK